MITRKSLADTYAEHDAIIEAAQTAKREATLAYRGQLDGLGMDKDNIKAEIEGFKLAYRRKVAIEKKGEDVVEHRDAIADEIYLEITAPNAPRATRVEIIEEFDPATGEFKPAGNDAGGAETVVRPAASAPVSAQPIPAVAESPRSTQVADVGIGGEAEPAPREATDQGASDGSIVASAPVATPNDYTKPNPWCRDPEDCGVHASWNHMCGGCMRLKAERQAVGAVQ